MLSIVFDLVLLGSMIPLVMRLGEGAADGSGKSQMGQAATSVTPATQTGALASSCPTTWHM